MIYLQGIGKELHGIIRRLCNPPGATLLGGASFLEYPREYLESLNAHAIDHHYGEWDYIYASCGVTKPEYDLWLEKYAGILRDSRDIPILDLGCGYGNDTLYLHERGYKVVSCDLSMEALKRLNHFVDKPVIRNFDMLTGLPFDTGSARIIIADLSLHYFSWADTRRIINDIERVLSNGGYLLCRVNSTRDTHHGTGEGLQLEEDYYEMKGREKRFFSQDRLKELFINWHISYMGEYSLIRFGKEKMLWEVAARKDDK
jgi:SAM-dependent methyltransferase